MKRTVAISAAGSAVLVGVSTVVSTRRSRPRWLRAAQLSAPVQIARDRYGIPKITAGSREDALFGLGYSIADDRLFQMDTLRRSALGRLSELAGPATLDTDRLMRMLDIESIAGQMVATANETSRRALDSFTAGVNLRIDRGPLPMEFRVLRYRPEPWRPEDSAAIMRLMGWSLSAFQTTDLTVELLRQAVGDEWTDAIAAGRLADSPPVVREPTASPLAIPAGALPFPPGGASNAWAVAGERSTTGFPLLANDPHLAYTNPSIWAEASIDAPGLHLAGLTLPGVPGFAFGRTPSFAWGFTAAMVPQTLIYRERLSDDGQRVAEGDSWTDIATREVEIRVKGQAAERFTIRSTPRGPLLSDIMSGWSSDSFSLHWTAAATRPDEVDAWLALAAATSVDDALEARTGIVTPTLNMAAADSLGNIATIGVGAWPVRCGAAGLLDRKAFPPTVLDSNETPVELNPSRGWIASANNPVLGMDSADSIFGYYEPDYRIRRIADQLETRARHSVSDMRTLQLDLYSLHAAELTPHLLALAADALPEWARIDLEGWDYQTPPESRATLLFQAIYRHWVIVSLSHRLPSNVVDRLLESLNVGDIPMGFCDRLLQGDYPAWWQENEREKAARLVVRDALQWLVQQFGPDHEAWTWGALHTITWTHPFGQIPGRHQRFVNVGPFPLGGDRSTVSPTGFDPGNLFRVTGGASMRLLADLRRPDRTWATNTLGQRGRPLSRNSRDQVADFLAGRVHRIWGQPATPRVVLEPER